MRNLLLIMLIFLASCNTGIKNEPKKNQANPRNIKDSIIRIHMKLSAFGVESNYVPNIDADIDFINNSSTCKKSYYNPALKDSLYTLNKDEMKYIAGILNDSILDKLKKEYKAPKSDQPTSTVIITTKMKTYTIVDYGLVGDYPMPELYRIVYKLGY